MMLTKKVARVRIATTVKRSWFSMLAGLYGDIEGGRWPSDKYASDPVAFVREILRENPEPHQIEIMQSVVSDRKVTVRSGQKTGKTKLVVWLAIWFYCSFPGAKVIMSAATQAQIGGVLWLELQRTLRLAKLHYGGKVDKCPDCKSGKQHGLSIEDPAANPQTGLRAEDTRQIRGFTVRDIEGMAGLSGAHMLFINDEASQLPPRIFEAIEGNQAGGGCMWIMISNPVRTEGPFYDSHTRHSRYWKTYHLDSERIAQSQRDRGLCIPGMASIKQIEGWVEQYGRKSPFFVNRVKGEFYLEEAGRIISLALITSQQAAWTDAADEGELTIGVDPAGDGEEGDHWAFCITRGLKVVALFAERGLSEDEGEEKVRALIRTYRRGDEIPVVYIDGDGPIGSRFAGRLRGLSESLRVSDPRNWYKAVGVRGSQKAYRQAQLYDTVRDELWCNAREWLEAGGTIPAGFELETELHCPEWSNVGNQHKLKATDKKEMRKRLNRSPDRADAFCLSVWGFGRNVGVVVEKPEIKESTLPEWEQESNGSDPYKGRWWEK